MHRFGSSGRPRRRATLLSTAVVALALTGAAAATASAAAAPAANLAARTHTASPADSGGWTAVNASSAVAFRNSPNWNDVAGVGGFVNGQTIDLLCYEFGGPAGPYSNALWYDALDENTGAVAWINDHYLNTPGTAANPQPQTGTCEGPAGYGSGTDNYSGDNFTALATAQWSNFPNGNYNAGFSFFGGDSIDLGCYTFGGAFGPYGNTLWYWAYDNTRNEYGWISDHDLSTPGTAANPQPQTWECDPGYYF